MPSRLIGVYKNGREREIAHMVTKNENILVQFGRHWGEVDHQWQSLSNIIVSLPDRAVIRNQNGLVEQSVLGSNTFDICGNGEFDFHIVGMQRVRVLGRDRKSHRFVSFRVENTTP